MRKRDIELGHYLGTNCPQVEMTGQNGLKRKVLAGNTKAVLRLIQSIPSKKAEPFKIWLAQVETRERYEKEMGRKIISPANANDKKLLDDKKNND